MRQSRAHVRQNLCVYEAPERDVLGVQPRDDVVMLPEAGVLVSDETWSAKKGMIAGTEKARPVATVPQRINGSERLPPFRAGVRQNNEKMPAIRIVARSGAGDM